MAAGLLRFVLAKELRGDMLLHEQWLEHCLSEEYSKRDGSLCNSQLAYLLKRLSVVGDDGKIANGAWDQYRYGWKLGINDWKEYNYLTAAMLEWAMGANLGDNTIRSHGVVVDLEFRRTVLGGIYYLFLALIEEMGIENTSIRIDCKKIGSDMAVCLSPIHIPWSSVPQPVPLCREGTTAVRKLFELASANTTVATDSSSTTTWGLLYSLGWSSDDSEDRPRMCEDNGKLSLTLKNASAKWNGNEFWLHYSNKQEGNTK